MQNYFEEWFQFHEIIYENQRVYGKGRVTGD